MTARDAHVAVVSVGTRLEYGGVPFTVVGLQAERLLLLSADGRSVLMHTATLLADASTRIVGGGAFTAEAVGPVLDGLADTERQEVSERLGHVREAVTGFRSGFAELALPGEPRECYRSGVPLLDRYAAKAAEMGVSVRTVQRWAAAWQRSGPVGLVDRRHVRGTDRLGGVDPRWLQMCRTVLCEHVDAARPTRQLVLEKVAARLVAEHGDGAVPIPGRRKAYDVLAELARGTNAFAGSTSGKRSIAGRPTGVYGRLRPTRPGEYVLLDTTVLDVFAMEPVTLAWVPVQLSVAMDLYSRSITGLRLSPVSAKSVDAAVVLFEAVSTGTHTGTGGGLLPYPGLPDLVVTDAERTQIGPARSARALPAVAAESVVVDHGKIYVSEHLLSVCARLGISVQPARPFMPTDKAALERFFKTLREGLLEALPGYKGPDIHSRGADPRAEAFYFLDELEQVIRSWIGEVYHVTAHEGLAEPAVPGLQLSPAEMFEHGLARAGRLKVPAVAGTAFDFLPTVWRTIQHYGVEIGGLRYNGAALNPWRNRTSSHAGAHAGKWPLRFDPDDVSAVFFQDPSDNSWHTLAWEHAEAFGMPFSAEALAYARKLALACGRHIDTRSALAELLERFDAGLVRNPVERRMAVRAAALAEARGTGPRLAAVLADTLVGDDDIDDEVAGAGADESAGLSDEEFYAGALGVLR